MNPNEPIGLYVHIPFCLKKCSYCDFCSFPDFDKQKRKEYINALKKEILSYNRKEKISINTVFFGGGTPSILEADEFEEIYKAILGSFILTDDIEFTIEVNPKTLTEKKLSKYISCGVNRISIGLQTIHDNEYKMLGRIHNFEDFQNTYNLVRRSGIDNINVDLMYGIPGQTLDSLAETLRKVAELKPEHISAYSLILEEGTRLFDIKDSLVFPDEDADFDMYTLISNFFKEAGYYHYEISNYAMPGYECQHNLKYWRCNEYIGLGLAAYSYFNGERFGNTNKFSEYFSENPTKYSYRESIDMESKAYEYVMLSLRLSEGFSTEEYKKLFGFDFLSSRKDVISKFISSGHMKHENNRIYLTEKGFYISNAILTELI